jgi:triphosphatase
MQKRILDHQEIEWQFDAADPESVERWLEEHRSAWGLEVSLGETKKLADTYYDTEDWRFFRAGYALRVRRDSENVEATMKALASPQDGGLKKRREISEPLKNSGAGALATARGPVGDRLRLLAGTRDLRPLFEIHTRRRIFELRSEEIDGPNGSDGEVVVGPEGDIRRNEEGSVFADEVKVDALGNIHKLEKGRILAEVALDESEFSGGEEGASLTRIEVEVADEGSCAGVAAFVDGLLGSLDLRPTGTSKFETGLAAAGLKPTFAPDFGPAEIDTSMSAGEVAFAILRRHFATMLAHEPGVRLGEDPEELHDMRVATRRLRSALKLYKDSLPRRAERYERDLRFFGRALGDVRDLDVHIERLGAEVQQEVVTALEERRVEARRRMLQALDSNRHERFIASFSGTLRRGRSPAPTGPILEVAPGLVRRRYKKVRKDVGALGEDSPPEDFHDLRKKGRRLRYAVEPLQGIYGKPAEKMVKLLKNVQDELGVKQDLIVAAQSMEELALAGDLPPRAVFALGTMAGRYASEAAEIQARFLRSTEFRALQSGKPWERLRKAMQRKAGG